MVAHRFQRGVPRPANAGRKAGTPNKKTVERAQRIASIRASGKDPMTFFMDVLSNEANPYTERFAAAKELMPFIHPRLASIESRRGGETHEERLERMKDMLERRRQRATAIDLVPTDSGSLVPAVGGVMKRNRGGRG